MEFIEEIKVTIPPTDYDKFLEHLKGMSPENIVEFIHEQTLIEELTHHPLKLLKACVKRSELEFLWKEEFRSKLEIVFQVAFNELEHGYFIDLGQYIPYPEELEQAFRNAHLEENKKEAFLKVFSSDAYKNFINVCSKRA
jgi:hypothetical protein